MKIESKLTDLIEEISEDIEWEIESYKKAKDNLMHAASSIEEDQIESPAIIAAYVADMQTSYAKIKELNERLEMVKHLQGKL